MSQNHKCLRCGKDFLCEDPECTGNAGTCAECTQIIRRQVSGSLLRFAQGLMEVAAIANDAGEFSTETASEVVPKMIKGSTIAGVILIDEQKDRLSIGLNFRPSIEQRIKTEPGFAQAFITAFTNAVELVVMEETKGKVC